MGGDSDPKEVNRLAKSVFMIDFCNHTYKIGWYSGKDELSKDIELELFDYIKLGHYDDKFGPLNNETTNQRLYKVINGELKDITEKFWKKATR
jgi:anaerobic ribonucleoside-triphosphate reductase activating protein